MLLHGVSWQAVSTLLGKILAFGAAAVQARFLGKAGYGELAAVLTTLSLFSLVSSASSGGVSVKYVSELRATDSGRASRIAGLGILGGTLLGLVASVACVLGARYIAEGTFKSSTLTVPIEICGSSLVVMAVSSSIGGILVGLKAFRAEALARTVQAVAWFLLVLILVPPFNLNGAAAGFALSQVVGLLAMTLALGSETRRLGFRVEFKGAWQERAVFWHFGLPTAFYGYLVVPAAWIGSAILARQPNGFAELGGYAAAMQFRNVIWQAWSVLQSVASPLLSERNGSRDHAGFRRLFDWTFRWTWAGGLLACTGCIIAGGFLLRLFGRQFEGESLTLSLVMVTTYLTLVGGTAGMALQMLNRSWQGLWAYAVYALASVGTAALVVRWWGGPGLALAFAIGTAAQALLLVGLVVNYGRLSARRYIGYLLLGLAVIATIAASFVFRAGVLGLLLSVEVAGVVVLAIYVTRLKSTMAQVAAYLQGGRW